MSKEKKMEKNCIFCKIIRKELSSKIRYEDDELIAVDDINPHTPIHILIIPKKHLSNLNEVQRDDILILGKMLYVAKELANKMGIGEKGYRIIINTGRDGGQLVEHLHMHLLGGKRLGPKLVA